MGNPSVILVGVSGGISAYKAAEVVSALARAGHEVHVAMTRAAGEFVTPTTFASLSRRRVLTRMFPAPDATAGEDLFPHLYPASRADAFVLCPATADAMARIAAGMADDVVAASVLALPGGCRRLFAPAMNSAMWANPAVQANVRRLEAAGWIRIGPGTGALACGVSGDGRMAEPAEILDRVASALEPAGPLAGRRVLILSGPTREPIDPVRFISNASSGRMGRALALEAAGRGAAVDFVSGPVAEAQLPGASGLTVRRVTTAREMLAVAAPLARRADIVILAAAVADVAPARPRAAKASKSSLGRSLALAPTPDIAATLSAARRPGQVFVGFALESAGGRSRAARKLAAKKLDAIVLNDTASPGADGASFAWLDRARGARWQAWGRLDKAACARRILDTAVRLAPASRSPIKKGSD
ncbi:MAG: bifunctional phosphopantothenoylcysteine decarboxylase/phosphopantothenate--cysteine ligase CoaBC [Lentisphaerae bacterium]|nr:bifunctional phosphopantothenoylcysteine decarboxylase/phosphopantothenate--cysteine ligase CoaBC [Lentisphaerota bacterium]